ncbi:heterokaryon incompatibility protein-domain-containing protein [Xylariaceae sp. FL1019]|nr:heterokaryon incompatibility protein-domain-containing protein [Xylariaceae sp. FL1019]
MAPRKSSKTSEIQRILARRQLFSGSKLCPQCSKVPWEQFDDPVAFPRPESNTIMGDVYLLGSIRSVLRKSRYCISCQFAIELAGETLESELTSFPLLSTVSYVIPRFTPEFSVRKMTLRGKPHPGHHNREYVRQLRIKVVDPAIVFPFRGECFLIAKQLKPQQNMFQPNDASFTARYRPQVAKISLLASWMKECDYDCIQDQEHARACAHVPLQLDHGLVLKLIDVTSYSIVQVPTSYPVPRYVCLSYVWGASKMVHLLRSNITNLQKKGSLRQLSSPQTLIDAISLVSLLGEKYIWIDALCIVQDDPKELQGMVSRMNLIYQGAVFTIVAAGGKDADAGLAGLRPHTRCPAPRLMSLGPLQFYFPIFDFNDPKDKDYLEGTQWSSRSWTYQEGVLSKRRLIFTNDQIYWSCSKHTRCEQIHFEGTWFFKDFNHEVSLEQHMANDEYGLTAGVEEVLPYICRYSNTTVRYPPDRLNAFKGVLSSIGSIHKETFFAALPISRFIRALFWCLIPDIGTEQVFYDKLEQFQVDQGRQFPFPSWSWLAWKGQVSFDELSLPAMNTPSGVPDSICSIVDIFINDQGMLTPLTDVRLASSGTLPSTMNTRSTPKAGREPPLAWKSASDSKYSFEDYNGRSDILRDRRLFFWAESVTLDFDNTSKFFWPHHPFESKDGIKVNVSTCTFWEYGGLHEFIAIAERYCHANAIVVMEISRGEDGTAFREAIGFIRTKVWDGIPNKERKWIELA